MSEEQTIVPRYGESWEFLKRFRSGPVVVTGITPDGPKRLPTDTFDTGAEGERERFLPWVEAAGRMPANLYFNVAVPMGPTTERKGREWVRAVEYLHVDVDPRPGHDLAAEQARIVAILRDPPAGIPRPTGIVFTGGGYAGFWKLAAPIVTNGDVAAADDAGRYSAALADALGGDHCHDPSRIMRLPGTVNIPDARKVKRGRVPAPAAVVEWHPDRVYDLATFHKSERPEVPATGSGDTAAPPIDYTNSRAVARDELRAMGLAEEWIDRASRVHADPSIKDRYASRSEHAFAVVRAMLNAGIDELTVYSVLMDETYGVSESVRGRGRAYAIRQIERAKAKGDKRGATVPPSGAIVITDGGLNEAIRAAEANALESGVPYFDHAGELVRTVRVGADERQRTDIRRDSAAIILRQVTAHNLVQWMESTGKCVKVNRSGDFVKTTPPLTLAQHLLSRAGAWPWRELVAVVNAPAMLPDGSVLQAPGYDAASGLFYDALGVDFAAVPENPTREDAIAALSEYHALYERCDFVRTDEESAASAPWHKTAAFASVLQAHLTGLARPAVPVSPALVITAPYAGSAKTKIAECIAVGNTGRVPAAVTFGANVEEFNKLFYVMLREGDPWVFVDNLSVALGGSDPLCQALTSGLVQCRILGVSERMAVRNVAGIIATGINAAVKGDLTRRVLVCNLDPGCERPEERTFDFDPVDRARDRWPRLVVAGLTALRAYHVAGCPQPDGGLRPLGSFGEWTRLVRGCLRWCGYADPADTRAGLDADDPARSAELDILRAWVGAVGDRAVTLADVSVRGYECPLFRSLVEFSGVPVFNARTIGRKLMALRNRITAGLVLRRVGDTRNGVARWRVEGVAPAWLDYGTDAGAGVLA